MKTDFSNKTEIELTCEACGKKFPCGFATGKCWCFDVDLKEEALAEINQEFRNCLCEDCLKSRETIG